MTTIKKPTGEELCWMLWSAPGSTAAQAMTLCFDAGIAHARETEKELDAARATISTLEARVRELEGMLTDTNRAWVAVVNQRDSLTKELATTRERARELEIESTDRNVAFFAEEHRANRLEKELASARLKHKDDAGQIVKLLRAEEELATVRERVKELEREAKHWESEAIAFKVRDDRHIAELATAREQHRAEVEELKSKTSTAEREHKFEFAARRKVEIERDRFMSRLGQTQAQLAVRDEELDRLIGLVEKTGHGRVNDYWREIHDMIDAHRTKVGEFPVELGKRAHALLEQEDRAKASPPPGEQPKKNPHIGQSLDDFLQETGELYEVNAMVADMQASRRNCISDEGPPRVGDVVRLLRISEWHNRYGGGVHSVGTEGMAAIVAESDGNGGVPRGETCVHFDNTSGGTWGVWEVIRRAQPSPVASDPSGDKCTMCVGSGEIARDLSGLLERCPACNGTGKESSAAMPLKGGRGPHIGSALDAAHMAETGCVVAPGEAHDCPAVYPGEQADARALVEEFVAERKAAADLDRPPGGHGPHHDEIAELKELTEELCKGIGRLEEYARKADKHTWEAVCRSCPCPMLSPASRERGGE